MEEQKPNIQTIQELVIEGRYREAFLKLPESIQQIALAVRDQVGAATENIITDEPDTYKMEIINALEENQFQKAATLLAAHPENAPKKVAPAPSPASVSPAPKQKPPETKRPPTPRKEKPPYFPRAMDMRTFRDVEADFPPSCERLADEVFQGKDSRLTAWLTSMVHDHQVPSTHGIEFFVDEKIDGLRRNATRKLQARPPQPLNAYESNAYYHPDAYFAELVSENQTLLGEKSFGNLIEYVIVELFDALCKYEPYKRKIRRVLKSSPEEDLFKKSDIVVELKSGNFVSVDVTTATSEKTLRRKREILDRSHRIRLWDLEVMLRKEGELDERESLMALPALGQVDPDLFRDFTVRRMNAIKSGDTRSVVDIFRESTAALRKNADGEIDGLIRMVGG